MIERTRALTAGLTVGTLPMIWFAVVASGGLALRLSHVFGALTVALVAWPGRSATIDRATLSFVAAVTGLIVLGAVGNLAWFGSGYWPMSEVLRFSVNAAIGVGVAVVVAEADAAADARLRHRLLAGTLIGALSAATWWVSALAGSPIGLGGLLGRIIAGDTRAVLFEAHLPAIRSLHGTDVLLGVRHGAIFGFITAGAVASVVAAQPLVERRWRLAAHSFMVLAVGLSIVSLSRSALAALAAGGLAWLVVERDRLLWNPIAYAGAAMGLAGTLTTLATGLGDRVFADTESLSSRQINAGEVLAAEWSILGSPPLPADTDSPHNMLVEFAAAGGVPMLIASVLIGLVVVAGTLTAARRPPMVTMLAIIVLVRLLSAARGSLDTAAVIALIAFVVIVQQGPSPTDPFHRHARPGKTTPVVCS